MAGTMRALHTCMSIHKVEQQSKNFGAAALVTFISCLDVAEV